MKWCLGFDLRSPHCSPAAYARWLGPRQSYVAMHVLDAGLEALADMAEREQLRVGATEALHQAVRAADLPADRTTIEVISSHHPVEAFAQLAERHRVDGIIISRRAAYGEDRVVHLGRTARRLLRRLPVPVVVVPPELAPKGIGRGPVVLAGDGRHDARRAMAFGRDVAAAVDRDLRMVHVVREPFRPRGAPRAYLAGMYEAYRRQQHEALERWRSAYNLGGLPCDETHGHVVPRLLDVSADLDACLIVCASRQLTAGERIFSSSVGSQLASVSARAIAVSPHA